MGAGCQNKQTISTEQPTIPPVSSSTEKTVTTVSPPEEATEKITEKQEPSGEVTLYKGDWFDISYPKDFTASPTTPQRVYNGITQVDTDEARFLSPDKSVEFFVYSPQWYGEPKEYTNVAPTEKIISEKIEETKASERPGQYGDTLMRWVTIEANDGSYSRSFVSIQQQLGTGSELHHVFGIKYKNKAAYDTYKNAYVAFKASLKQYAD